MTEPVATMEPNGPDAAKLRATEAGGHSQGDGPSAASPGGRFAYASGSKPLEGFTIKRGVGHGGFGEVYYALSDAGKEVALKLIRRNLDVELRGIRHCLNLKHPNLLSVHDIRHDQTGDNWVVMEFVAGPSLEDAIASHPQGMPQEEALAWLFGIGAGVACLHDHGIVHRDLKPGNIFCDEGVVKLGDYGLSKFISCSRRSGHTESVGTVHYMAPEIANGRYGKEIDIYALGVILYEMLTGRVPFEGESVGEVLMRHLTTPPDVSMLAEPFRGVVAKALEKDPAKRFGSVAEMLSALPRPARCEVHVDPLLANSAGRRPESDVAGGTRVVGGMPSRSVGMSPEPHGDEDDAMPHRAVGAGAGGVGDEPIYRAVHRAVFRARDAWRRNPMSTKKKVILVVLAVALFANVPWIAVAAGALLMLYACYFTVRAFVLAHHDRKRGAGDGGRRVGERGAVGPAMPASTPSTAKAGEAGPTDRPPAATGDWRTANRPRWASRRVGKRELAAELLRQKPFRARLAGLLGSLLGSAAVALVMSLVIVVLFRFRDVPHSGSLVLAWGSDQSGQLAWLALVTIAGSWAVLIPSKFWEGVDGDAMLRRFILMVIGLGVGALALGAQCFLGAYLPNSHGMGMSNYAGALYNGLGVEDLGTALRCYLASFGAMFFLLRWWRQADPFRYTRMSLLSLGICGLLAWWVGSVCSFPQPWLIMAVCAMSISVQLAGPWLHPSQRRLGGSTWRNRPVETES